MSTAAKCMVCAHLPDARPDQEQRGCSVCPRVIPSAAELARTARNTATTRDLMIAALNSPWMAAARVQRKAAS